MPYLLREHPDAAVCGTRYTLAVVKEKLAEHGISPRLVELSPRASTRVGGMEVEPLQVTHSIPDAVGYALRTPAGTVVHTGDFKVDWSPPDGRLLDVRRFAELGEEGVACLLSDSTNAEREGTSASESQVGEALARIFGAPYARGRIVVAMFGSNIHRVQSVVRAALQHGRKVCLLGRSMQQNVRLALDMHSDEIDIMRRMGATEAAIRAPFWLHAAFEGLAGGAFALLLLFATYRGALYLLSREPHPVLSLFWVGFLDLPTALLLPAVGAFAGFAGSLLSLQKTRPAA